MTKTILLTGCNGLLGQKLTAKLSKREAVKLIATAMGENRNYSGENYIYQPLDITNKELLEEMFEKYKPDEIINCAAMTQVDQCETERDKCKRVNADAVHTMVELCKKFGTKLIHVSTDFVFDGEKGNYQEKDVPNPLSWYGKMKYEAEQSILNSDINYAIARTVLVYGFIPQLGRSNIILWAKSALEKGDPINVVNDQFRSPTLVDDLADGIIQISMREGKGIYHLSGPEEMCITDIVKGVAKYWKLDDSIMTEVDSASLAQPAKRPPRTGFIILKAQTELGYKPHTFREGLTIMDKQMRDKN